MKNWGSEGTSNVTEATQPGSGGLKVWTQNCRRKCCFQLASLERPAGLSCPSFRAMLVSAQWWAWPKCILGRAASQHWASRLRESETHFVHYKWKADETLNVMLWLPLLRGAGPLWAVTPNKTYYLGAIGRQTSCKHCALRTAAICSPASEPLSPGLHVDSHLGQFPSWYHNSVTRLGLVDKWFPSHMASSPNTEHGAWLPGSSLMLPVETSSQHSRFTLPVSVGMRMVGKALTPGIGWALTLGTVTSSLALGAGKQETEAQRG